jgi:hypothetical protein
MCRLGILMTGISILFCSRVAFGAPVILNEYNAVSNSNFLNGGDSAVDEDGGRASDSYFGRIQGNGGNWFELVVIADHLDMRRWNLDIYENGQFDETLVLTNHPIWSDLRSGTIITVSVDVPSETSYNPEAGDWWINVQANNDADGQYIEASNFPVSSNGWQLRIRDAGGAVVFGPAGEGVSPQTGIGNTEVFRLEDDPSDSITADSDQYDDGKDLSTFGAPNRWGTQNFGALRNVAPVPSSITLLDPNGAEILTAGSTYTIKWESQGVVNNVLVQFSIDDGKTWTGVYPSNVGNTGQYDWLVPLVDADKCLIRVSSSDNLGVYDVSDATFSIYELSLVGDIAADCPVDMFKLVLLNWL